jgi:hypothetical protein
MMIADPAELVEARREELLAEASMERLAAKLPRQSSAVRHGLAVACVRLADWLDGSSRYLRATEAGAEDWVVPTISG